MNDQKERKTRCTTAFSAAYAEFLAWAEESSKAKESMRDAEAFRSSFTTSM
jgi:hypothetical protein